MCKVTVMDMEWMYKTPRFATAKKHRLSLGQEPMLCPCNSCKNKLAQQDNMVQSHLVRYGFIKDYTVVDGR
jgi:hypothetical protein